MVKKKAKKKPVKKAVVITNHVRMEAPKADIDDIGPADAKKLIHGLRKSRDFFERHPNKWIKGVVRNDEGGFCLIGRLYEEGVPDDVLDQAGLGDIPSFNDDEKTTVADAIAALVYWEKQLLEGIAAMLRPWRGWRI